MEKQYRTMSENLKSQVKILKIYSDTNLLTNDVRKQLEKINVHFGRKVENGKSDIHKIIAEERICNPNNSDVCAYHYLRLKEEMEKIKSGLARGYSARNLESQEDIKPGFARSKPCKAEHKTHWIKSFKKMGIHIRVATNTTEQHIWKNPIKKE